MNEQVSFQLEVDCLFGLPGSAFFRTWCGRARQPAVEVLPADRKVHQILPRLGDRSLSWTARRCLEKLLLLRESQVRVVDDLCGRYSEGRKRNWFGATGSGAPHLPTPRSGQNVDPWPCRAHASAFPPATSRCRFSHASIHGPGSPFPSLSVNMTRVTFFAHGRPPRFTPASYPGADVPAAASSKSAPQPPPPPPHYTQTSAPERPHRPDWRPHASPFRPWTQSPASRSGVRVGLALV
jgi:hypothetical protein